jgi:hypothetical protein
MLLGCHAAPLGILAEYFRNPLAPMVFNLVYRLGGHQVTAIFAKVSLSGVGVKLLALCRNS